MKHKADKVMKVKSYYHFIKAVNYYLVANGFENGMFIKDNCEGYEKYKKQLLKENFGELVEKSGVKFMDQVIEFAKEFNNEMNAIIIYSEKEVCAQASFEMKNLAMVTGKLGKTANGLISLKEKNNSQGLFDMGICPKFGVGSQAIHTKEFEDKMKEKWGIKTLPKTVNASQYDSLEKGVLKNIFIFGEDPLGCAQNKVKVAGWLSIAEFVVVQDYFMTETAKQANLILPASFPTETGGSFTNTQKVIQEFDDVLESRIEKSSVDQISTLLSKFKLKGSDSVQDVMMEAISLLPAETQKEQLQFNYTADKNCHQLFDYGCDIIVKRFEEHFKKSLK